MPQLHCYVPEAIARIAQRRAAEAGLSLSRYLSTLVKQDAGASASWPEGYFELFGMWAGSPPMRPPQLPLETRLNIE